MQTFEINKKNTITRSKCNLMTHSKDGEPDFCDVVLTHDHLIILSDNFSTKGECLFNIPYDRIIEFIHINKVESEVKYKKSILNGLLSMVTLFISGRAYMDTKQSNDKLNLVFWHVDGNKREFILDMVDYGERGLTSAFSRAMNQTKCEL